MRIYSLWTFVLSGHFGRYPATRRKPGRDLHPSWLANAAQIVQYIVRQGFIEYSLVPIALHIEFQALKLDTGLIRRVFDKNLAEVRLARLRTDACELRTTDRNTVIPLRAGVLKQLNFRGFAHCQTTITDSEHII